LSATVTAVPSRADRTSEALLDAYVASSANTPTLRIVIAISSSTSPKPPSSRRSRRTIRRSATDYAFSGRMYGLSAPARRAARSDSSAARRLG
jgi:hypothetical protein